MTNEKTKETLIKLSFGIAWGKGRGSGKTVIALRYMEAIEEAMRALDKQIPKKPNFETVKYGKTYETWICPCCGNRYELAYEEYHDFCPNCGQAIDWSEENEK